MFTIVLRNKNPFSKTCDILVDGTVFQNMRQFVR